MFSNQIMKFEANNTHIGEKFIQQALEFSVFFLILEIIK